MEYAARYKVGEVVRVLHSYNDGKRWIPADAVARVRAVVVSERGSLGKPMAQYALGWLGFPSVWVWEDGLWPVFMGAKEA